MGDQVAVATQKSLLDNMQTYSLNATMCSVINHLQPVSIFDRLEEIPDSGIAKTAWVDSELRVSTYACSTAVQILVSYLLDLVNKFS